MSPTDITLHLSLHLTLFPPYQICVLIYIVILRHWTTSVNRSNFSKIWHVHLWWHRARSLEWQQMSHPPSPSAVLKLASRFCCRHDDRHGRLLAR